VDVLERLEARLRSLAEESAEVRARLAEVVAAIAKDGVVVEGSQGQPRPNALLTVERGLRRDLFRLERELLVVERQAEQERLLRRTNAAFASSRG
jgi:hypothetical protein